MKKGCCKTHNLVRSYTAIVGFLMILQLERKILWYVFVFRTDFYGLGVEYY